MGVDDTRRVIHPLQSESDRHAAKGLRRISYTCRESRAIGKGGAVYSTDKLLLVL